MKTIEVVEYDPKWPEVFERLRARAWSVLNDVSLSIEHVGSTSVPGLAAKPIIDMSVVVPSRADVRKAIERLATIGYVHRGTLGVEGREAFFPPTDLPAHNMYVCIQGGSGLVNHLALRDYLRTHPDEAQTYGELKKRLAREFPNDIDAYVDGKTEFVVDILNRSGLDAAVLAGITDANTKLEIRPASPTELGRLTEIAHAAKRHWGYDEELIALWRKDLTVSNTDLTFCATRGSIVIGFCALSRDGDVFELEHMWVDPPWIGTSGGSTLFRHAVETVRSQGGRLLRIASDPNAAGFYEKMGAKLVGSVPSTPSGRTIPLLEFASPPTSPD